MVLFESLIFQLRRQSPKSQDMPQEAFGYVNKLRDYRIRLFIEDENILYLMCIEGLYL